jgi:uncharacterized membrane protein HdeD (DUF308 family)
MKKEIIIDLLASLFIGAMGLVIMINPGHGISFIQFYIGIIVALIGLLFVISYFIGKKQAFLKILEGVVLIVIGIFLFFSTRFSLSLLNIILLVWVIIEGILGFGHMFKYISHRIKFWPLIFLYAIIALAIGVYILINLAQGQTITNNINWQIHLVQLAGLVAFLKGIVGILDIISYNKLYKNK